MKKAITNKFFLKKFCTIDKKAYLCTRIQPSGVRTLLGLCYGVMAALEFLVLSVQVRILVAQPSICFWLFTQNANFGLVAQLVIATDS